MLAMKPNRAHATCVTELPLHHRDPFDRTRIARARIEGLAIMTVERALEAHGVPLLR
jgi:PIN domain nuclease of toxin-antitoxin system